MSGSQPPVGSSPTARRPSILADQLGPRPTGGRASASQAPVLPPMSSPIKSPASQDTAATSRSGFVSPESIPGRVMAGSPESATSRTTLRTSAGPPGSVAARTEALLDRTASLSRTLAMRRVLSSESVEAVTLEKHELEPQSPMSSTRSESLTSLARITRLMGSNMSSFTSQAKYEKAYHRVTETTSVLAAYTAVASILLMIIDNELSVDNGNINSSITLLLKVLMSISTLILLACILIYWEATLTLDKRKYRAPVDSTLLWNHLTRQFVAECISVLIHVGPWFDNSPGAANVWISDLCGMLMLSRLFLVVRAVRVTSPLSSQGAKFLGALTGIQFSNGFVLKSYMDTHPATVFFAGSLISVSAGGYCIFVAERNMMLGSGIGPNASGIGVSSFADGVWHLVVTMTTVGYGDTVPASSLGKIFSISSAVLGILLTALMITVINKKMQLTPGEHRVVAFLKRDRFRKQQRADAASLIQSAWRLTRARQRGASRLTIQQFEEDMYVRIRSRKMMRRIGDASLTDVGVAPMLENLHVSANMIIKSCETLVEGMEDSAKYSVATDARMIDVMERHRALEARVSMIDEKLDAILAIVQQNAASSRQHQKQ